MNVVCDAHVHLYPCYDLAAAFRCLAGNLSAMSADAGIRAAFLAERRDCRYFEQLRDGDAAVDGWTVDPHENFLRMARGDEAVCLVAGRQVVTRETLEIVSLGSAREIDGGRPVDDTIRDILDAGALPALNWAPGKWWFRRGRVVKDLLDHVSPGDLVLCDTSLRPVGWGEPALMREAAARGFTVIAGSDPLPLAGEERHAGRYGFTGDLDIDPATPGISILDALRSGDARVVRGGRRGGPFETAVRLARNEVERRTGTNHG